MFCGPAPAYSISLTFFSKNRTETSFGRLSANDIIDVTSLLVIYFSETLFRTFILILIKGIKFYDISSRSLSAGGKREKGAAGCKLTTTALIIPKQ